MRLTQQQIAAIRISAKEVFGAGAQVWLFGSRVDDRRRGGDIDLLVRPAATHIKPSLASKIRFLNKLEGRIGERKVDVVVEADNVHVRLCEWRMKQGCCCEKHP